MSRNVDPQAVYALPPSAPIVVRWLAYFKERFPLLGHSVLIASFYSSNQFLAQALTHPADAVHYNPTAALGFVTILCFFLHLRVFDDHKDYQEDCRNFPQRLLQRGVIRLADLKRLGGLAIGVEIVLSAWAGVGPLISVLMVLGYSVLMLKEFFVRKWLKRHFFFYAASHMLVMPLLSVTVFSFATSEPPWRAPGWFLLYSLVSFFVGFNWELSRKIRAPQEERSGVDSYSRIFGVYGAASMVLLVRTIDTGLVCLIGWRLGLSVWFYVAVFTLFGLSLIGVIHYAAKATPAAAARLELYAGVYIVAFDLILAVEVARHFGFEVGAIR